VKNKEGEREREKKRVLEREEWGAFYLLIANFFAT